MLTSPRIRPNSFRQKEDSAAPTPSFNQMQTMLDGIFINSSRLTKEMGVLDSDINNLNSLIKQKNQLNRR